jgi:diguanylate cyclase (GGDEF)-like protein/PAS domain S-box-containing protein
MPSSRDRTRGGRGRSGAEDTAPATGAPQDSHASADTRALVSAPVAIFETDAAGSAVFVNDRWLDYAGLTREQSLGFGWAQAIHPEDRERVVSAWKAAVAKGADLDLEFRAQRSDGTTTWLSGSSTSLRDEDGTITGFVGVVSDISSAVATREALIEQNRFVDTVLDIAGALVCVFDPMGRFLRFNRACEQISGYTFEEIEGRPFFDFLIPKDEVEAVRAALGRLRSGEPPAPNVNHWLIRDGSMRLISWTNASLFDDHGALTHIVSVGIDITDERRAQGALQGVEAIGTLLAKHGPTPDSMGAVLTTLGEAMDYRYLAVLLRDGDELRLSAQRGYDDLPTEFHPERGIIGRVVRTGEAAFVPDVAVDPDYVAGSPDVVSEIAVPLTVDGQSLGVLNIESTSEAPMSTFDLRLAQTVAERLAAAIVLGREQQALSERARLFGALTGFAQTANSTLASERLMPTLVEAMASVIEADVCGLTVLERATGRYLVRAVSGAIELGVVGTEIRPGEGISGRAMTSRALIVDRLERARFAPSIQQFVAADWLSMAAVPLVRDGAVLGVVTLGRATDREPAFSAQECEVLTLLAAQTALAIANAELLDEVSELAVRDGLTGLFNRRHFDASVDQLLLRRARERKKRPPLAAIMFDLDYFGHFNKEHGHQAGDAVLKLFASILLGRFRSSDLLARYGGEEFVAILEGATLADATRIADEIRAELAARTVPGADGAELRATVSAGCAALDDAEPTREALLRAADVGLFMAKRAGRNQVVAV